MQGLFSLPNTSQTWHDHPYCLWLLGKRWRLCLLSERCVRPLSESLYQFCCQGDAMYLCRLPQFGSKETLCIYAVYHSLAPRRCSVQTSVLLLVTCHFTICSLWENVLVIAVDRNHIKCINKEPCHKVLIQIPREQATQKYITLKGSVIDISTDGHLLKILLLFVLTVFLYPNIDPIMHSLHDM